MKRLDLASAVMCRQGQRSVVLVRFVHVIVVTTPQLTDAVI
ncbi:hypothetical protein QWY77_00875 [Thalassotalea ponticola]|nr:hypothetical protein [Thalassotalea ponticola]